jgi:hypothetical protein
MYSSTIAICTCGHRSITNLQHCRLSCLRLAGAAALVPHTHAFLLLGRMAGQYARWDGCAQRSP